MKQSLYFLKSKLIAVIPGDSIVAAALNNPKVGLLVTAAIIAAVLVSIYVILSTILTFREKHLKNKYRISSLNELGLLNRNLVGLSSEKKQIIQFEIPKIHRWKNILVIRNVNPALKKDDVINKREQLERIYAPIFHLEIADVILSEYNPFWLFFWKNKRTDLILVFGSVPAKYSFEQIQNKEPFKLVVGKAPFGEKIWDLTNTPAALVAAAQGSGKSTLVISLVTQLLYKEYPARIIIATFKDPAHDFPQFVGNNDVTLISHATEQGYRLLISEIVGLLKTEIPRITERLKSENVKNWYELRDPELILLVIDEAFTIASNESWKQDVKLYNDLVSLGRAYGILNMCLSQGSKAKEFEQIGIDVNRFQLKIGSQVTTAELSTTLYNDPDIGRDETLVKGKMIFREGLKPTRIRAVYSDHIKTFPVKRKSSHTLPGFDNALSPSVETITTIPGDPLSLQDATGKVSTDGNRRNRLIRFKKGVF